MSLRKDFYESRERSDFACKSISYREVLFILYWNKSSEAENSSIYVTKMV